MSVATTLFSSPGARRRHASRTHAHSHLRVVRPGVAAERALRLDGGSNGVLLAPVLAGGVAVVALVLLGFVLLRG